MQTDIDLKQIQRKVYLSYFEDGLWDICLGIFLVGWGLMFLLEFTAVVGGIWVAVYFLILGLKRWLTYPRAGYIKISGARRQQVRMVILGAVLFLLGLAVFFLFSLATRPAWLGDYFILLFGAMMAVVIAMLGYWWKVTHWYVYAGMVFLAAASHQWLDTPLNLTFIVPGGIIMLYGLVLLVVFLRRYPKSTGKELDAGP
jgi:hypothetical protein